MKFVTQVSQLTLQMEGIEQLWALKQRIQIPRFAISEISFEPDMPVVQDFSGRLRMVGMVLPWSFAAGTFHKGDEHEFWYVRFKQPGVMTIELKPDTLNYDRIRVTCSEDMAETVTTWWRAGTGGSARA